MLQTRRMWGAVLLLVIAAGCGPSLPEGAKPTKPITAKVTYKGAPVEKAIVTFITGDAAATGITDAAGVAKMKTYVEGDGSVLGTHKVIVTKTEIEGGGNEAATDSAEYDPAGAEGKAPPPIKYLVPQKYGSPVTTDLTVEVSDSSPAEVTFDLKD
jgi:hypothetical protein